MTFARVSSNAIVLALVVTAPVAIGLAFWIREAMEERNSTKEIWK